MATKTKSASDAAADEIRNQKWRIAGGDLSRALAALKPAISPRPLKAALLSVLVGDGEMIATNLEMSIAVRIAVDAVPEPMLLPFARLVAIARSLEPDQSVSFSAEGGSVVVKTKASKWTLPTEAVAEFPQTFTGSGLTPICRIPCDQFSRAVGSVVMAADDSSGRIALGGVLVDVADGEVNLVASDGRRMAIVEIAIDQAVDNSQTLVPAATMRAAAALSAGCSGAVQLERGPAGIVLSSESWRIESRIVDGHFPRWRSVLPDRDVAQTVVGRSDLLSAVAAARVCVDDVSRGVMFTFGGGDTLRMEARSSSVGEATVRCPVVEVGKVVAVRMDPTYVADWLRTLDSKDADPNITIDAADAGSAVVFRCDDATNVVMPMGEA
jgi:DNA polymerase-3 subunit beta